MEPEAGTGPSGRRSAELGGRTGEAAVGGRRSAAGARRVGPDGNCGRSGRNLNGLDPAATAAQEPGWPGGRGYSPGSRQSPLSLMTTIGTRV